MWDKMLYFNLAAFPIYILLWFTTAYRKMTRGRTNVLYLVITALASITVFCEIGAHMGMRSYPLSSETVKYVRVMEYGYFISRNGVNAIYLFFIYSVTRNWFRIKNLGRKILLLLPYFGILFMLIKNERTHYVFDVSKNIGYMRGDHIGIVYALASFYLLYGILFLILQRKTVTFGEWVALLSTYAFNVLAVIIQFFNPKLLVECYFTSLTLLFVVLFIQRPENRVDIRTGLASYQAFREEMYKIKATGEHLQIVIVFMQNARELRRFLGVDDYHDYIRSIEKSIKKANEKEKLPLEVYFDHPGTFYIILDEVDYNPAQNIDEIRALVRGKSADARKRGVFPVYKIVTVSFPEDIAEPKELFRFGRDIDRFADVDHLFWRASKIIAKKEYQVEANMSEILDRAIKGQQLKMDIRPVWVVHEQSESAAEISLRLTDEVFGEIDEDTLREAAKARGSALRLSQYILDRVFCYMGSSEFAESGYNVVAVRLSTFHCMQIDFIDHIRSLREKYEVNPEKICFSISDGGYDKMSPRLLQNLHQLDMHGYLLSLEGYGKGYANIMHILQMPVKFVRLDRSMVEAASTTRGRALLRGTIQTIKSIPLWVIAPAGDSEETFSMLEDMGCDIVVREAREIK